MTDPRLAWDPATGSAYVNNLRQAARAQATQRLYATFLTMELAPLLAGRYRRERLTKPSLFLHGNDDRAVPPDLEQVADEVDFAPAQRQQLAAAQPAERGGEVDRGVLLIGGGAHECADLPRREDVNPRPTACSWSAERWGPLLLASSALATQQKKPRKRGFPERARQDSNL